ncbi:hypothetical protein AGMMS49983_02430 [Clostridia bacterium]|nr:hypothetical protein AGMMS49983_02430 [Clostridia bacterium]
MMFEPSQEKSQKAHQLIEQLFANSVEDADKYTVAYAYFMKSGPFSKKVFNYVVGFSVQDKEIVVVPTDSDIAEAGEVIKLSESNIESAKYGLQGDVKIKSSVLEKELRFVLPAYVPTTLEAAYILPILQEETAVAFKDFIKNLNK